MKERKLKFISIENFTLRTPENNLHNVRYFGVSECCLCVGVNVILEVGTLSLKTLLNSQINRYELN